MEGRSRHELLTLAGRNVVFCSNAGSVVALDAETGRRAWGFRYPRGRKADANRSADPAPAIAVGGRVFVAPTDADRIYALDSETGQSVWPSSGLTEGANIVGVSSGKLIVAVAGPVRGVRGLSLANGSYLEPEGWLPHNGGGFLGMAVVSCRMTQLSGRRKGGCTSWDRTMACQSPMDKPGIPGTPCTQMVCWSLSRQRRYWVTSRRRSGSAHRTRDRNARDSRTGRSSRECACDGRDRHCTRVAPGCRP